MSDTIIEKTIAFVKETLAGAEGGHDWYHIERVWLTARYIREKEGSGDLLIIELAALLHDISDAKFNGGDDEQGGRMAREFLVNQGDSMRQTAVDVHLMMFNPVKANTSFFGLIDTEKHLHQG